MTDEPKSPAQISQAQTSPAQTGLPRWLIYGFAAKLVLVAGVVGFLLWWTSR